MNAKHDRVFLKHLMDFNVVPIIIWSFDGNVLSANDAFLDLIGYSRTEMDAGKINWRALTPPEYLPLDEHCIQELEKFPIATPYVKEYFRKDGSRVAIRLFNGCDPEVPGQGVAMIIEIEVY
jgi:PAS domain S-box-containing protein